jgi:hypothetical protein
LSAATAAAGCTIFKLLAFLLQLGCFYLSFFIKANAFAFAFAFVLFLVWGRVWGLGLAGIRLLAATFLCGAGNLLTGYRLQASCGR